MNLPAEILARILQNIHEDGSTLPYLLRPSDDEDQRQRIKSLHACCLVNRTWHVQGTPLLYSQFKHNGEGHSFARLWHFLRTVVEKPELGTLVKHLDLRECHSKTKGRKERVGVRHLQSRQRDLQPMLATGDELELRDLKKALKLQARAPFMAILAARLPNVSRMYLSVGFAGHRQHESYFNKPFVQALQGSKALQQLSEATFFDSEIICDGESMRMYPAISMSGAEDWFLRPSLRKLELLDLRPSWIPTISDQSLGKSNVAHLTVSCNGDTRLSSPLFEGALEACLRLPKALVSLTLHMQSFSSMGGDNRLNYMIAHDELWRILCHHIHTLQYLDLYDTDACRQQYRPEFNRKAPMGKLTDFTSLTSLRIQPEMLLGGVNGILPAPYPLRETMPRSLHSLTFYNLYDEKALINNAALQTEVLQILTSTDPPLLPDLHFLLLQDTFDGHLRKTVQNSDIRNRLTALQQACHDRAIIFRIMSPENLPLGGRNLSQHPGAHDPEGRAREAGEAGVDGLQRMTPERERYEFVLPPGRDLLTL